MRGTTDSEKLAEKEDELTVNLKSKKHEINREKMLPINTIFTDTREYLLGEEIKNEIIPVIECPEIYATIEGIPVTVLIDSGSKVTTISEEFYNENKGVLKHCLLLPVTGVTVKGAIKGKMTKVRSQIMAITEFGKTKTYIKYLIVPGLIRDVLLGVDSLKPLRSLIDLDQMCLRVKYNDVMDVIPAIGASENENKVEAITQSDMDFKIIKEINQNSRPVQNLSTFEENNENITLEEINEIVDQTELSE